ncbi:hypothetical protein QYF61_003970 [Mycteria americana]|uniref:Uncharacterized protein n=1 Tax=Mycteria americana TaxID=33587 RepID=A0AAN7RIM8_MYCAM|nr:hypothetical protein QYF61_003970 [Mycteria americana]
MATQARELSSSPSPQHWCSHIWTSVSRCGAPESGGMRRNWRGSRGDLPGWVEAQGSIVVACNYLKGAFQDKGAFLGSGKRSAAWKVQSGCKEKEGSLKEYPCGVRGHQRESGSAHGFVFQGKGSEGGETSVKDMELVEVSCERGETTVALIFEYGQKCNPGNHRLYSLAWVIH